MEIIIFNKVYVNLKLLVHEEFLTHATMVKILATLRGHWPKRCSLIQWLELVTGRVYLAQFFGDKLLFHDLTSEDINFLKT